MKTHNVFPNSKKNISFILVIVFFIHLFFSQVAFAHEQNDKVLYEIDTYDHFHIEDRHFFRYTNAPGQDHFFDLEVYVLKNSVWTDHLIINRIKKLSTFFNKCDVRIYQINIRFIESEMYSYHLFQRKSDHYQELLNLKKSLMTDKSTRALKLIYVFGFEDPTNGIAFTDRSKGASTQLGGFAFISTEVLNWEQSQRRRLDPNFSVEGHELGHILLNSGHVLYGQTNFMAPEATSAKISKHQCNSIKESPYVYQ